MGNNPWQRELIRQVRDTTGIKIVALQHIDDYIANDEGFADEAPYNIGPCEFLNLIRNAEYVFTDSFHCSVFSILYKKNFLPSIVLIKTHCKIQIHVLITCFVLQDFLRDVLLKA